MLVTTSAKVVQCLEKAAEARTKANMSYLPADQLFWREMEKKWLKLAESYSFLDRFNDFTREKKARRDYH